MSKVTQLAPWQDLNPGSSLRANAPLARGHASLGRGGQRVRTTLTLSFGFRHALALRCSCLHPTETGPTLARMGKGHVRILEACLVTGLEARGRQHWWISNWTSALAAKKNPSIGWIARDALRQQCPWGHPGTDGRGHLAIYVSFSTRLKFRDRSLNWGGKGCKRGWHPTAS